MPIELKQLPRLQTQLVITPALKQAIELLQVSRLELVTMVKKELEENPALEEVPGEESLPEESPLTEDPFPAQGSEINWEEYWDGYYREGSIARRHSDPGEYRILDNYCREQSLSDYLLWQLTLSPADPEIEKVGRYVIGLIDDDGYLRVSDEEIADATGSSLERAREAVRVLQEFDPPGVAARTLEECLLTQLKNRKMKEPLAERILRRHLAELEKGEYDKIAQETGACLDAVRRAIKFISELEPRPGREFTPPEPIYLVPDIFIFKLDEESDYVILLNDDGLPKLKISSFYQETISSGTLATEEKQYLQERIRKALWLIRAIHQRQHTLYRVAQALVELQRDFFDHGPGFLRPLALRDIAERVGVHESTVSRAVANKYVHTAHGLVEFKSFFNRGLEGEGGGLIASESVRTQLAELIQSEDRSHPLTDQDLTEILRKSGIRISRRTVTKYRRMMRISSAQERHHAYARKNGTSHTP